MGCGHRGALLSDESGAIKPAMIEIILCENNGLFSHPSAMLSHYQV